MAPMRVNDVRGFDFGLGETADMLRESVRGFAAARISPRAEEIDRSNIFPRDLWPELGKLGVHGITVEEEWGGAGLGYLEHCVAMEEISRASAAIGLSYGAHSDLSWASSACTASRSRRNGAGRAWAISSTASPWRRSRAPPPPSACPTARIPI